MSVNLKNYIKIGGLALACTGFAAYFFLNKKESTQKSSCQLNREQVIKILKEFDKQFYGVLQNLAVYAMQINQQTQGKLAFEEVKEYLLQDPSIQEQIQKIEEQIYQKFEITEEIFKQALENQFQNDEQIQQMQKKLESEMNQACKGEVPDHQTTIPDHLTFQKVLQIFTEIMLSSTLHIYDSIQKARDQGFTENPLQSPEIQQALNPVILEKKKEEILSSHGLNDLEDSPSKIFTCAMQNYMKNNKQFNEIFKIIEVHHQKIMVGIFKGQKQEREKVSEGYLNLIQYELKKLEIDQIIQEEVAQKDVINQQYKESIQNIEKQIIHQNKEELLVDSVNQQILLENQQEKADVNNDIQLQEQEQIINSEIQENLQDQEKDQILKSEIQEVYQEEVIIIQQKIEENEMVESQFKQFESQQATIISSQEEKF